MIPNEKVGPWSLKDYPTLDGPKVFSCFHCGGGSTMGYKLAGCQVLGGVEIDPRMMSVYRANHHPQHSYLMGVRDFLEIPNEKLPDDLFSLDILDGSPPCSSFSTSGSREKAWGKAKAFREGQVQQRLDDLFFDFIAIADKLQPRVVVAENVSGLIKGLARGYVKEIFAAFKAAGYKVQLFLLNASRMGVPQKRERTFFIARRIDTGFQDLHLEFNEQPIPFKEIDEGVDVPRRRLTEYMKNQWLNTKKGEIVAKARKRMGLSHRFFNRIRLGEDRVCETITAHVDNDLYHPESPCFLTDTEIIKIQTFPFDFNFMRQKVGYICGMSVPPFMMQRVALAIRRQWFTL